MIYIYIELQE